ncbi:MAG: hypothetical protein AB1642_03630 [Pseudomonadota bacterium]
MANQYIFFAQALADRFIAGAGALGVAGRTRADPIEGVVVDLPDGLADDLLDALEEQYDLLMEEQRELIDAQGEDDESVVMGVTVTLPDGASCLVSLPAPLGRRLVEHFSTDEIHALVAAVAASVLDPSDAPLCCRN